MTEEQNHIQLAINFTELVRTTLGPRGMNKMVVSNNAINCLTNDGATIVNSLKGGNPLIEMFKNLAKSQEEAVGDGTTTAIVLSGQLLQNAQILINKGIHPTTVINGYNIAMANAINYLKSKAEEPKIDAIMRTAFGTKIQPDLVEHFISTLKKVKNAKDLKIYKIRSSDPFKSEIYKGHIFEGFTRDDQMPKEIDGKIAVLNFPVNVKWDNYQVTNVKDLKDVAEYDIALKRDVVKKLKEMDVKWVFYTDTCTEFDAYLTEANISGVAIFRAEDIDSVCIATKTRAITDPTLINEEHLGYGKVKYKKGEDSNPGAIYVNGNVETLVIHGPTIHVLNEIERSLDDVVRLMKHDLSMVVGAGCIEIEVANYLRGLKLGGKEQLAIEMFSESIESIPMIIAENCGLDAIEVLTNLKALHSSGEKDIGVDIVKGVSDARKRGIFEPVLVKLHAISSATQVANQILKLDAILQGNEE